MKKSIRVTRSARKHRIGNAHIIAALVDAGEAALVEGDAQHFYGTDDRGVDLHIIVIPDDRRAGWAVIHCAPAEWR